MIFTPPDDLSAVRFPSVFLAGSIEMGKADGWQNYVSGIFDRANFSVINPRRADWDSSWKQEVTNTPFVEQVNWERQGLKDAVYVLFYFQPGTLCPITLFEFGKHIDKRCMYNGVQYSALAVVCPEGFWRRGNVLLECGNYGIPIYQSIDDAADGLIERARGWK
jgi:hypothetical protein